jgi:hypothetical protein
LVLRLQVHKATKTDQCAQFVCAAEHCELSATHLLV